MLQVLTGKQLALLKPASWEDPFENFLLQAKAKIGKEVATLEARSCSTKNTQHYGNGVFGAGHARQLP